MNNRALFFKHVAQTSPAPLALEIVKAKGCKMWDKEGMEYIDLIAGISVANVGHSNKKVIKAIRKQSEQYLHLLVYGEFIESPEVKYAHLLASNLPEQLNSVYFTNSGAEAVEGAMKLAKRYTNRTEIIAFHQSYHGSTQGALSIMGDEYWRNAYRPLLPDVRHEEYGTQAAIDVISAKTACVVLEAVQAERGVYAPTVAWMQALRRKCDEVGALLIFDEIQTGFGRTGSLWAFERYGMVPDVLMLGKALGGGMPMGAFIARREVMNVITENPVLGHITTFGGHPLCCAAGAAAFEYLLEKELVAQVASKAALFKELLKHPKIKAIRNEGLLIAVEFESFDVNKPIIDAAISKGVVTDWFLFAPHCMRIAPPLIISEKEIKKACAVILECCDLVG